VVAAGGTFVDGAAVVDGQLFTGRAWPDHPSWMRAFMEHLRKVAPVE
jgi:protease I